MEPHIKELFKKGKLFDEGEMFGSPEYHHLCYIQMGIERKMRDTYGMEAHQLLLDLLCAYYDIEEYRYLHWFHQGYLAARAEQKQGKGPAPESPCPCPYRAGLSSRDDP